jgi:uncharacterized protein
MDGLKRTLAAAALCAGTGAAAAPPDMATLSVGAEAEGAKTAAAQKAVDEKLRRVLEAAKAAGVAPADVRTAQYSVSPRQVFAPGKPPRNDGYKVSSTVEIKLRKLKDLGALLDAVAEAGADHVYGVTFEVSNRRELEDQAREEAARDARRKAEALARSLGVKLGPLLSAGEALHHEPRPMFRLAAMSADGGGFPVAPGESEVRVQVTASYGIE